MEIKTKYNCGDMVYLVYNNKKLIRPICPTCKSSLEPIKENNKIVVHVKLGKIIINHLYDTEIRYNVSFKIGEVGIHDTYPEAELFLTKKEAEDYFNQQN